MRHGVRGALFEGFVESDKKRGTFETHVTMDVRGGAGDGSGTRIVVIPVRVDLGAVADRPVRRHPDVDYNAEKAGVTK